MEWVPDFCAEKEKNQELTMVYIMYNICVIYFLACIQQKVDTETSNDERQIVNDNVRAIATMFNIHNLSIYYTCVHVYCIHTTANE